MSTVCPIGKRCHVSGKGISKFGSKFPKAMIRELASSSVQLVTRDESKRIASGTLIWPTVVLCAAHSVENLHIDDIEILMFFECDERSAPSGVRKDNNVQPCSPLASDAQARVARILETGGADDLDYALLAIEWKRAREQHGAHVVDLPRIVTIPRPSHRLSKELVLIGHPEGQPTQAAVGYLVRQAGPNPHTLRGTEYSYATFAATPGFSGGGVFNDRGEIVGVLRGPRRYDPNTGVGGMAFLDLGRSAQLIRLAKYGFMRPCERIWSWLADQSPLKAGDPRKRIVFRPVRSVSGHG